MSWGDWIAGGVAGLGGGALGAWATLKATRSSLDHEVAMAEQERSRRSREALVDASNRCNTQLLTNLFLLNVPAQQFPFIELEYGAIDELLTFGNQVPTEVAFKLDTAGSFIRRYNAAARYANDKYPLSGSTGPAEAQWVGARVPIDDAVAAMKAWVAANKAQWEKERLSVRR